MAPPASSGEVTLGTRSSASAWQSGVCPRRSVSRSWGSSTPPFGEGHSPQKCVVPVSKPRVSLCGQSCTASRQRYVLRDASTGRCASILDGTSASLAGAAGHTPAMRHGLLLLGCRPVWHVPVRNSTRLTQAQEKMIQSRRKRETCEAAAYVTQCRFTVNFFL